MENNVYFISCFGAIFMVFLFLIIRAYYRIGTLENRVDFLVRDKQKLENDIFELKHRIEKTEAGEEKIMASLQLLQSVTTDRFDTLTNTFDQLNKDYRADHDSMVKLCEKFADILCEFRDDIKKPKTFTVLDSDTYSGDVHEEDTDIEQPESDPPMTANYETTDDPGREIRFDHGNEVVKYRWIFPSEEESHPVFGQWYTVIGKLHYGYKKEDGSPVISTDEGMFNGNVFITKGNDYFEKVYAYIKMPSSADIMQKIVDVYLKKEQ